MEMIWAQSGALQEWNASIHLFMSGHATPPDWHCMISVHLCKKDSLHAVDLDSFVQSPHAVGLHESMKEEHGQAGLRPGQGHLLRLLERGGHLGGPVELPGRFPARL